MHCLDKSRIHVKVNRKTTFAAVAIATVATVLSAVAYKLGAVKKRERVT